ncbi:MAG: hypothetical protein JKY52_00200 [Flavobacteriales bacterium]|nr:hypothetical protein [Flavobacteriales bacterium]
MIDKGIFDQKHVWVPFRDGWHFTSARNSGGDVELLIGARAWDKEGGWEGNQFTWSFIGPLFSAKKEHVASTMSENGIEITGEEIADIALKVKELFPKAKMNIN